MGHETFMPGDEAGKFEIQALLGAGGHAEVYRATDPGGHPVAIKVLQERYRGLSHLQQRFLNEGRVMQAIDDVHVVRFIDFGVTDAGVPWMAMELLDGVLLRDYLHNAGGRIDVAKALRFARQLAQGADSAHQHRVYHRDLKPENVMIVDLDIVKIFDFGIAKLRGWGNKTTLPDEAWGTPMYMAPEQLSGDTIDGRTDVYAVGLLLYEMIVGQHAFSLKDGSGPTPPQLKEMQKRGPQPLADLMPEIDGHVGELLAKALAWAPEDRFQTMAALRQAVGEALKRWRREHRTIVVPAGVVTPAPADQATAAQAIAAQTIAAQATLVEQARGGEARASEAEAKPFAAVAVTQRMDPPGSAAPALRATTDPPASGERARAQWSFKTVPLNEWEAASTRLPAAVASEPGVLHDRAESAAASVTPVCTGAPVREEPATEAMAEQGADAPNPDSGVAVPQGQVHDPREETAGRVPREEAAARGPREEAAAHIRIASYVVVTAVTFWTVLGLLYMTQGGRPGSAPAATPATALAPATVEATAAPRPAGETLAATTAEPAGIDAGADAASTGPEQGDAAPRTSTTPPRAAPPKKVERLGPIGGPPKY